jgi:N-acetylneuraminic acid mutarotase
MPSGRSGASTFILDNKAYVVGGRLGLTDRTEMWCYDPITDSWATKAPIPVARRLAASFEIDGKGYVACGLTGSSTKLNDLWQYDPDQDTWFQKAAFPGGARYGTYYFALNGFGYLGTGNTGSSDGPMLSDAWKYDPVANTWSASIAIPDLARFGTSSFTVNGKGYVFGGKESDLDFSPNLWSFDPAVQQWTLLAPFPGSPRSSPLAFVYYDYAVVGCGRNDNENFFDVWQYKPSINGWIAAPSYPGESSLSGTSFSINNRAFGGLGWRLDDNTSRSDLWELVKPDNTGVDDLNSAEDVLSIFPEPSSRSGPLTVRIGSNDLVHAQLLDLHGCEVERWTFKRETQLHLSNLAPGVYVIRWRTAGSTGSKRVILN